MIGNTLQAIAYAAFYLISLLPYRALYALSGVLYFFTYRVARYRLSTARRNIAAAFPGKSREELRRMERGFYRWLSDYFVETVKLMSVSHEELMRHVEFRGTEAVEDCFDRGQACAGILGHYCNWELLSAAGKVFTRHKEAVVGLIYAPLSSKTLDRLFIKIRQSMGGVCVPKRDILRYLTSFRNQNLMNIFGYMADQRPQCPNSQLRLTFLNRTANVMTGAERIARKMGNAVFYVDMERPGRGRYVCTFRLITDNPSSMPRHEITRRFFEMLEQSVRRDPCLYLWTMDKAEN